MSAKSARSLLFALSLWVAVAITFTGCGSSANNNNEADQLERHYTIGLVSNNPNGLQNVQGFRDGMTDLGYVEGENTTYIFEGEPVAGDALDAHLQKMVDEKVDLIFTAGTPTGVAAYRITKDSGIPVVFGVIADPIAAGVMEDLTKPGGNMTGVMLSDNQDRRLELLLEIVPDINRVLVPYNPEDPAPVSALSQLTEAAPALDIEIVEAPTPTDDDVGALLEDFPEDIDAIFLVPDSVVNARLDDIVALSLERNLPVSGPSMVQIEGGALTAYGIVHHKAGYQAAAIADQVLMGSAPGDLPVQTADFYLGVNLVTAEAIGVEVPYDTLQQAEVIIRADEE